MEKTSVTISIDDHGDNSSENAIQEDEHSHTKEQLLSLLKRSLLQPEEQRSFDLRGLVCPVQKLQVSHVPRTLDACGDTLLILRHVLCCCGLIELDLHDDKVRANVIEKLLLTREKDHELADDSVDKHDAYGNQQRVKGSLGSGEEEDGGLRYNGRYHAQERAEFNRQPPSLTTRRQLRPLFSLQKLVLYDNHTFGDEGAITLSRVIQNGLLMNLQWLSLENTNIGPAGCLELIRAMTANFPLIKSGGDEATMNNDKSAKKGDSKHRNNNENQRPGALPVAAATQCLLPHLKHLNLSKNPLLDDNVASSLAQVLLYGNPDTVFPSMEHIDIHDCPNIGEVGLTEFAKALHHRYSHYDDEDFLLSPRTRSVGVELVMSIHQGAKNDLVEAFLDLPHYAHKVTMFLRSNDSDTNFFFKDLLILPFLRRYQYPTVYNPPFNAPFVPRVQNLYLKLVAMMLSRRYHQQEIADREEDKGEENRANGSRQSTEDGVRQRLLTSKLEGLLSLRLLLRMDPGGLLHILPALLEHCFQFQRMRQLFNDTFRDEGALTKCDAKLNLPPLHCACAVLPMAHWFFHHQSTSGNFRHHFVHAEKFSEFVAFTGWIISNLLELPNQNLASVVEPGPLQRLPLHVFLDFSRRFHTHQSYFGKENPSMKHLEKHWNAFHRLLEANPEAMSVEDAIGRLPVEVAFLSADWEVYERIYEHLTQERATQNESSDIKDRDDSDESNDDDSKDRDTDDSDRAAANEVAVAEEENDNLIEAAKEEADGGYPHFARITASRFYYHFDVCFTLLRMAPQAVQKWNH